MKKLLCLLLTILMITPVLQVSAATKTVELVDFFPGVTATVSNVIDEKECEVVADRNCLYISNKSVITFNTPLNALYVYQGKSDDYVRFSGYNPEYNVFDSPECMLDGEIVPGPFHINVKDFVDETGEATHLKEGATLRFNKPGHYMMGIGVGFEDDGFYCVTVVDGDFEEEEEPIVPGLDDRYPSEYDESIIEISGITHFEYDRPTVNYHDRVAICNSPVEIEVKRDLKMFSIVPIIEFNGELILDEDSFYETLNESDIVYDASYGGEVIPAKKGKNVTLSEPGLYNIFAEVGYMGDWTELVIEIPDPNTTYDAKYTDSKVMVDGKEVKFEAYNIADNNYFKLRDIAKVLSGTSKQFEVEWDAVNERVNMISGVPYTPVGGELAAGDGRAKTATNGTSNISKDSQPVMLRSYMINGNNYFKLRDLGKLFDFDVSWDGVNNCVLIDSEAFYTED